MARADTALLGPAGSRQTGLDLLRGLAALSVVLTHLTAAAHWLTPQVPHIDYGGLGVEVFFVLSGYVILMTAYRSQGWYAFAVARWARLHPAFLACMLVTTIWVETAHLTIYYVSFPSWVMNLTMVPYWFGARPVDPVYWSLWFEIRFYIAVAAALPLVKRGYALHLSAIYLLLFVPFLSLKDAGYTTFFVMGIAFFGSRSRPALAGAVLVAAIFVGRHIDIGLVAPASVAIALRVRAPAKFASWCGAVSYPLYLVHNRVGTSLVVVLAGLLGVWPSLLVSIAAMIVAAAAVHRFVELPLTGLIKGSRLWAAAHRPRGQIVPIPSV